MTEQLTEDYIEAAPEETVEGPVRVAWAMVPKVNLLPIEILEGRRFRRTQALLGGAVLGAVLIAAGGTFWAQQGINDAQDDLTAAQGRVSSLQAEQAKYAAVPKTIAEVDAADSARTLAMGTDVLWYRYLNQIQDATPAGITLNGITVSMTGSTGTPTAATDPLSNTGIGTVTLNGTADQYDEVSNFLEAADGITGFTSPTLASASKQQEKIVFGSAAVIDTNALSGRYDKKAG